jgi:putative flippase GtrA
MTVTKKLRARIIQFAEYMVAGGAYFWSGYLVFFLLDKGLHWNLFATTMVSNLVGWTVNFILQRYWVFRNPKAKGHMGETTGRYIFITLVNFGLNYLILWGLKGIGITPYIGQFISSGFFTVWNYLWYRFWVFPERYQPQHKGKKRARR